MPRRLDSKVIKIRIKKNKGEMIHHKVAVLAEMKSALQSATVDKKRARNNLNLYIEAALAITKDNAKLEQLKNEKDNANPNQLKEEKYSV